MTARCTGRSSGRCTGRCCSADQRPQTRDHRQQTRDNRPERWIMAEIAWHVFAKPGAVRRPIQDRIAAIGWDEVVRVEHLGACWEWRGSVSSAGYGRVASGGRTGSTYVHRQMLSDSLGRPLFSGMLACHHCDNKRCVNPAHLYEGTYTSNALDLIARTPGRRRAPCRRHGSPLPCPTCQVVRSRRSIERVERAIRTLASEPPDLIADQLRRSPEATAALVHAMQVSR